MAALHSFPAISRSLGGHWSFMRALRHILLTELCDNLAERNGTKQVSEAAANETAANETATSKRKNRRE